VSTVMVIYHSDTGNTQALAELVADGARQGGAEVQMVPAGDLDLAAAGAADALAIGSPDYFSYVAGEVKALFDKILNDERFQGKPYVGFGTHGGGAKVLGVLDRLANSCKLAKVAEGVLVKNAPTGDDEAPARALGRAIAAAAG